MMCSVESLGPLLGFLMASHSRSQSNRTDHYVPVESVCRTSLIPLVIVNFIHPPSTTCFQDLYLLYVYLAGAVELLCTYTSLMALLYSHVLWFVQHQHQCSYCIKNSLVFLINFIVHQTSSYGLLCPDSLRSIMCANSTSFASKIDNYLGVLVTSRRLNTIKCFSFFLLHIALVLRCMFECG